MRRSARAQHASSWIGGDGVVWIRRRGRRRGRRGADRRQRVGPSGAGRCGRGRAGRASWPAGSRPSQRRSMRPSSPWWPSRSPTWCAAYAHRDRRLDRRGHRSRRDRRAVPPARPARPARRDGGGRDDVVGHRAGCGAGAAAPVARAAAPGGPRPSSRSSPAAPLCSRCACRPGLIRCAGSLAVVVGLGVALGCGAAKGGLSTGHAVALGACCVVTALLADRLVVRIAADRATPAPDQPRRARRCFPRSWSRRSCRWPDVSSGIPRRKGHRSLGGVAAGDAQGTGSSLVVILVVVLIAADRISLLIAESQIADRVQKSQELSAHPHVSIKGFPFLTQVLGGRYHEVDVSVRGITRNSLTVDKLTRAGARGQRSAEQGDVRVGARGAGRSRRSGRQPGLRQPERLHRRPARARC